MLHSWHNNEIRGFSGILILKMHLAYWYMPFCFWLCGPHQKKWSWGIKVGVHFSCFMTILSHFGFIIFSMTHKGVLLVNNKSPGKRELLQGVKQKICQKSTKMCRFERIVSLQVSYCYIAIFWWFFGFLVQCSTNYAVADTLDLAVQDNIMIATFVVNNRGHSNFTLGCNVA